MKWDDYKKNTYKTTKLPDNKKSSKMHPITQVMKWG